MILENSHCRITYTSKGKVNGNCKQWSPYTTYKCDKCNKIFTENSKIFEIRKQKINCEHCSKCGKSLVAKANVKIGLYDTDGNLKPNKGRFTSEKVSKLNKKEYKKYCKQRKKASTDFHKTLNDNPELYEAHYKKIYKNSKIGYISKGQKEIQILLEPYGFELEKNINGMFVDIVNVERKIIIEYFGDFFHANPRKYSPDDFIPVIKMTAKEKWNKDRKRNFKLRRFGYNVIVIWENKWMNNKKSVLKQLNELVQADFKYEKWWEYESEIKTKKMKNERLNKNKFVPLKEVEEYVSLGWEYGFIKRKKNETIKSRRN